MEVFFSSWNAFFWQVMNERPSSKILIVIFIITLICVLISILVCLIKSMMSKEELNLLPYVALSISLIAINITIAIPIISNIDDVVLYTYEEAESLYKSGHCQKAKKLYWSIYAMDYADSRDKMARCDYVSAKYYIDNVKYEDAFELLLPHLFDNPKDTSPEILNDMRDLVVSTMEGVSQVNQEKGMLINPEWMVGNWKDKDGNYVLVKMNEGYSMSGNIFNLVSDKKHYYSLKYGICKFIEIDTEELVAEIIFCPVSEDEVYVYNISSGKMYFLVRDRET